MTVFRIVIMKPARKYLKRQPRDQQERLLRAIYQLPHEGDIKQLIDQDNVYRLRVGDYRVLYSIYRNTLIVKVMDVNIRGNVYK